MSLQVRARLELAALCAAMGCCMAVAITRDRNPPFVPPPGATSDIDVFGRIVDRVRAGEGFYAASQDELRSHGYPTRSVFNWRTPVYAWVLGALPGASWCRALLISCTLGTILMTCQGMVRELGMPDAALSGFAFVGAMAWCFGTQTYLFTEVWAGVLITLSIGLMGKGWTGAGVAAGVLALFMRELALPYVLAGLALAAWHGRRREAAGWALGLGLFVAFMFVHAANVAARLTPADQAMTEGWVRFGGMRFILATAQTNVFLMPLPLWCTALIVPPSVLGLAAWRGEAGRRVGLTAGLYLAAFSVVGAPFNFYWGFITAPLLALGLGRFPGLLRRRINAAWGSKSGLTAAPRLGTT